MQAGAALRPYLGEQQVITLLAMGDIMFGRLVAKRGRHAHNLYSFVFIADVLRKGDPCLETLSLPCRQGGYPINANPQSCFFEPYMALRPRTAGFTVFPLANNHIFDYGPEGFPRYSYSAE